MATQRLVAPTSRVLLRLDAVPASRQARPSAGNFRGRHRILPGPLWIPRHGCDPASRAQRVIDQCLALSRLSETEGSTTRTFLSPPMHEVHRLLREFMEALGMKTSVDAAGNLRGLYSGGARARPRLVIGSHLDTVPNAGAFDGVLGVVLGAALVESLGGRYLPFDVEILGFSEEEGVRFGAAFLGSRAFVGDFPVDLLDARDRDGVTVAEAIKAFGLDPERIPDACYRQHGALMLGYLEFHIEQGPVLERLGLPLAAVEGIAGQSRFSIVFTGEANHAGTTPMDQRRDALAGASEWISEVECVGRATPSLVCTVGRLHVSPGAGNVIPAEVEASLDVRHLSNAVRIAAVDSILRSAESIARSRNLMFQAVPLLEQPAVDCDAELLRLLKKSIAAAGYPVHTMASGAGHDAMILAPFVRSAMLFLRSPGGISHHPAESVLAGDVAAAIDAGLCFLREIENSL